LGITCKGSGTVYAEWERGRIFDENIGNMFFKKIKGQSTATVMNYSKKAKSKQKPQALNTVELLRVGSAKLGIGPSQTMVLAERLYTQGYISYPRTETTHYSENFNFNPVVNMFKVIFI
jgi:DNA topoisomerase-3